MRDERREKRAVAKVCGSFHMLKWFQWEDAIVTGWREALSVTYTLENWHGTWKSPVWQGKSSSKPSLSGSMLSFRGVRIIPNYSISQISSIAGCLSAQAEGKLPIPASPRCLGAQRLDENMGSGKGACLRRCFFEPLGLFKIGTDFFNRIAINNENPIRDDEKKSTFLTGCPWFLCDLPT